MANEEQVKILKQGVEVWNKWREENPAANLSGANLNGANLLRADLRRANLHGAHLSDANLHGANLHGASLSDADLRAANLREADLSDAHLSGADVSGAKLSKATLSKATLSKATLRRADLSEADLSEAKLNGANLRGTTLRRANLSGADLSEADLNEANLRGANLSYADLTGAILSSARLNGANLNGANLSKANLIGTDLSEANLFGADLSEANLGEAIIGFTIFANINLSQTYGLDSIPHKSPSTIGTDTIQLSKGEIPEIFLRGCGLSDWEIESAKLYKPGISNQEINNIIYKIFDLRASQSIQISPLFISYSHVDTPFVEKLEPRLTERGIRFWRDVHEMKSGRMEKQVDYAMRQNPTVILILSENSTRSDWVEHEARLARELEKELDRDVLCPIALDDSWKSAKWPARLMEQIKEYNILDYSSWKDDNAFGQVFNKLISGLDMFYKPESLK